MFVLLPFSTMDKQTQLIIARMQVDNLFKLCEDFDYPKHLTNHLHPVKYELERQLKNVLDSERIID
jgi:hypothetical protein